MRGGKTWEAQGGMGGIGRWEAAWGMGGMWHGGRGGPHG